jgi:hypothetical protein
MSDQQFRTLVRSQIVPFAAVQQKPAEYATSWAGCQTYDQIYDNLAHYASNIMKRFGFRPHEIPDCLQIGFTVLWETLLQQPDFLTQKNRQQAVFFVLARCKISSMRSAARRYDSLDALISDDWHDTADEHAITGLEANRDERWAAWATDVDIRIDVQGIMNKLAAKYAHSFRDLVALYAVTTEVSRRDAASLAGVSVAQWNRAYHNGMLGEVQYAFAEVFLEQHSYEAVEVKPRVERPNGGKFTSAQAWRKRYQEGNTAPAETLLAKYAHKVCVAGAIQAQIEGKSYREAALSLGQNPKTFPKYMKRAVHMLKAAYA